MKILVLPSWYIPNGGEFFKEQALALKSKGHEVTVATLDAYSLRMPKKVIETSFLKILDNEEDGLHTLRKKYIVFPKIEIIQIIQQRMGFTKLIEYYIEKYGIPDIIHVHSVIWASLAAADAKVKYGIPYIITEHRGRFVRNRYVDPNQLKWSYNLFIKKGLKHANKVITVSNAIKEGLLKYEPMAENKMLTIPNMVDVNFFSSKEKKTTTSEDEFIYFSLAGLVSLKGFDLLIEAFAKVAGQYENVKLYIGGEGPEKENIIKLINRYQLQEKVIILGAINREQVRRYMHSSHVFVLPSRYEAFGVVYIEALASGLPIIGARSGGPEEIINFRNGELVDLNDVSSLSMAMKKVKDNYDRFNKEYIQNEAARLYSIDSVMQRLDQVINEVMKNE